MERTITLPVIKTFRCKETDKFWATGSTKKFESFVKPGIRKLAMLNAASSLSDLKAAAGNHLQALRDDRAGQHSIRSDKQFRVCFVFKKGAHTMSKFLNYKDVGFAPAQTTPGEILLDEFLKPRRISQTTLSRWMNINSMR